MTNKVRNGNIKEITLDSANANDGTPRGRKLLGQSVEKTGLGRSVVLDKNLQAIGGNKTVEVAADLDMEEVIFVHTTGNQLVAVVRDDLDLNDPTGQARQMAYYDNYVGQASLSWSPDQVKADMAAGLDLSALFLDSELRRLGVSVDGTGPDAAPQYERAAELVAEWGVAPGQLWQIPSLIEGIVHRLLCGDATVAADVERVTGGEVPAIMVTDPPYGVEYDASWRAEAGVNNNKAKMGKVANDDTADWTPAWTLYKGPVAYVWHAGRYGSVVQASLESTGLQVVSQIIWAKDRFALSRGDYHWQHEPCYYVVRKGKKHNWQGGRSQSTVWEIDSREDSGHGHSTQKPIECMGRPIANNTLPGQMVYDPFVGSGTTLVAGENLGRRVCAIDKDEAYIAISLQRYLDAFGIRAELVEGV